MLTPITIQRIVNRPTRSSHAAVECQAHFPVTFPNDTPGWVRCQRPAAALVNGRRVCRRCLNLGGKRTLHRAGLLPVTVGPSIR